MNDFKYFTSFLSSSTSLLVDDRAFLLCSPPDSAPIKHYWDFLQGDDDLSFAFIGSEILFDSGMEKIEESVEKDYLRGEGNSL